MAGGPVRACPEHRAELLEDGDRLRCPCDHDVSAWLVVRRGEVVAAGRASELGRSAYASAVWFGPDLDLQAMLRIALTTG